MAVLFPEPESPLMIIIFSCFNYVRIAPCNRLEGMAHSAGKGESKCSKFMVFVRDYRVDLVLVGSSHQLLFKCAVLE